ncbi:uncharacterized protein LOC132060958 [Lycium ferocissimum]|uniref:uncharacterized protein LOC132060958 n=1 Tax=Lycium ferocissimum TaxID=112874 RepID=UPI0028165B52|nr:uncharacterized protein LOC132060958 [Lycium ferocissimum]
MPPEKKVQMSLDVEVRDKNHYEIEKLIIRPNCLDTTLYYDERPSGVRASVLVYKDFATAEHHRDQLVRCGNISKGTHVAKPLLATLCQETNKGMLFVDQLYGHPPKGKMWKNLKNKVIGFLNFYRKKYQQILHDLSCIHSLNIHHANMAQEILYSIDGSVHLYNFQSSEDSKYLISVKT